LGANPFITIKGAADKLAIAFTTAQRGIERLERARIVKQVGDAKRERVYCATALLDILEEPVRLKASRQQVALRTLKTGALETALAQARQRPSF
jgi:hypothetical protein